MVEIIFNLSNIIGLIVFSLVGSLKAGKEKFDLFGISVVGYATALGGGTIRDILINKKPLILYSIYDVLFSSLGIFIGIIALKIFNKDVLKNKFILYLDAVGLAAFTTTGVLIAYKYSTTSFGVLVLGILTGTGGGIIADLLMRRTPTILKEDFYAMCSLIGGISFLIFENFSLTWGAFSTFFITLITRLLTIHYNWHVKIFN
ncbi:MAG: trimeric intracellular cation channel family protein [Persephonella sp.]|nr:MAG: trimeric intracellular cation channel family protein [Persephonella sp.]